MTARNSWGFSLFADDLRHELGGKFSLLGIYHADLIIPSDFPLVLPKFALLVKYFEDKGYFKDDIQIQIFLPGDDQDQPSITTIIPAAFRDNIPSAIEPEPDSDRLLAMTMPLLISPLEIKGEGFIKVRAVCSGTTARLGRLMVRKVLPSEMFQFTPSSTTASRPQSSQSPAGAPGSSS
jgi:hypothetical protein